MKNEKETKQLLLESAKKEFLEKGFSQASLRNICKEAGVTTGALYFFFKDKEDLFSSLVSEPLNQLAFYMKEHYSQEIDKANHGEVEEIGNDGDIKASQLVIHFMYQNFDAVELLLTKSQGTIFEHCIDQFVAITEEHYRQLANAMTDKKGIEPLDAYMIHWIAHMHIDMFVHMLTHERSEEKAQRHVQEITKYLIAGWNGMF